MIKKTCKVTWSCGCCWWCKH